jgi:hypothetical protein
MNGRPGGEERVRLLLNWHDPRCARADSGAGAMVEISGFPAAVLRTARATHGASPSSRHCEQYLSAEHCKVALLHPE